MTITDCIFAALLAWAVIYIAKIIWRAPDAATVAKMKTMDERDLNLDHHEQALRDAESVLITREQALRAEAERVRKLHAVALEIQERSKQEIAKYESIAAKARQQLAGARQRYKRKLNNES